MYLLSHSKPLLLEYYSGLCEQERIFIKTGRNKIARSSKRLYSYKEESTHTVNFELFKLRYQNINDMKK